MNKNLYILTLSLLLTIGKAQVYFNNRYDNFNNGDVLSGLNMLGNDYLFYGCAVNNFSFYSLNLGIVDSNGNRTKNKTYNRGSALIVPNNGSCIINSANDFIISGGYYYKTDTSLAFLWRFNNNLDSIGYYEYGFLNKVNQVLGVTKDATKYIYMAGWVDSLYKNTQILLIKADTLGNEIWKKQIGLPGWDETAYSIKTCANGDLLVSGLKDLRNSPQQGPFIMRLDTSGTVLWQNYYPSPNYANSSFDVMEMPNGDIVFTGGKAYPGTGPNGYTPRKPTLTRLTASGALVWQKEYGEIAEGHDFFTFLVNERNNFVISGVKVGIANSCVGMVYEINQNGDSLYSREYYLHNGSQNYFRDVVRAPDKGYVFAGFIRPIYANGGTGNQDIWLLKADSTFCTSSSPCGYPTAIDEYRILEGLSIYPNPANDLVHINFEGELEDAVLSLYDVSGRELQQVKLKSNSKQTIDLSAYQSGIYFYKAVSGNKVQQNKLVIIK